jgi:hypothetical protein
MATYRLEAINRCLNAIGENPVNSVHSGVPDAEAASRVIDQITKEVLTKGWSANSAFEQRLTPDQDGIIKVSANILKIDTAGRDRHLTVTVNQDVDGIDKLFKVKDQSFVFTKSVLVDIVYYFDIDGLPFPIQDYIAARAARVFQEAEMGSVSLDSFTSRREAEAWTALLDYEAEQEDNNVLTDSPYMREITGRNNILSGR